jgi:glutamyl-tRNA reductase
MANLSTQERVEAHVKYHFTIPRWDWDELRQIYRQWVHIEDDPLYRSFKQQGHHMTADLLKEMEKTLKSEVHSQQKDAQQSRRSVEKFREAQGDELTNRLVKAIKDASRARSMDYKRFCEIVHRITGAMFDLELKIKNLKEEMLL